MDGILLKYFVYVLLMMMLAAEACEEPKLCRKHARLCATHVKFRTKCPCTCEPDINFAKCCAHQKFTHEECRQLCTYEPKHEEKLKAIAVLCFNDFYKVLYCSSNGHSNSTECCMKNGVTKDMPDKAGCSIFCEVKPPSCSRLFEYLHCAQGEQVVKSLRCARENYDRPRWIPEADARCGVQLSPAL